MTRSTTKCQISKCRNVGRTEYDLITEETGEFICDVDAPFPVCKKHLMQALEMAFGQTEDAS